MKKRDIVELLKEYKDVKECGYKIYLSYEAIKRLCGLGDMAHVSEKLEWIIKTGEAEVIEVILPNENEKGLPVKRIKAVRLK